MAEGSARHRGSFAQRRWAGWVSGMGFHWNAFDPKAGARVIAVIAIAVLFGTLAGLDGTIVALATLVISMADAQGPLRHRIANLVGFTLILAAITALASVIEGEMWPVVITITVIALLSGLWYGTPRAAAASFLNVWLILLLPVIDSVPVSGAVAATILAGALVIAVATGIALVKARRSTPDAHAASPDAQVVPTTQDRHRPHLRWSSPVTIYAVSKAVAAGLATLIGWLIVGDHPYWATFAPLMIIRPDLDLTIRKGVDRTVGTVLGGVVGYTLIEPITNTTVIAALFLAAIFLQFATTNVHYGLMVFFLTLELVLSGTLGGAPSTALSLDRIIATILGVVISIVTVLVLVRFVDDEDASRAARTPSP